MSSPEHGELAEFSQGFDDVAAGWFSGFKADVSSFVSDDIDTDETDLEKANSAASWVNDKLSDGDSHGRDQ